MGNFILGMVVTLLVLLPSFNVLLKTYKESCARARQDATIYLEELLKRVNP